MPTLPLRPIHAASDLALDPLIGSIVGSYRLLRNVASGSMGTLYLAEHTAMPRAFAVKILHPRHLLNDSIRAQFETEAKTLAQIRSEHVLQVVDVVYTIDGLPGIVTEFLEGDDLRTHLQRNARISVTTAADWIWQAAQGLSAAHAVGVVHRDIKPSNLFLSVQSSGRTQVKVVDFGVATQVTNGDSQVRVVGTPSYMAPEQATGAHLLGPHTDVYGLAAVFYRLVSGRPPYVGKNAADVLEQLQSKRPPSIRRLVPDLHADLAALIDCALDRNPERRPKSATEFANALEPFVQGGSSEHVAGSEDTLIVPRGSLERSEAQRRVRRHARTHASMWTVLLASMCGVLAGAVMAEAHSGALAVWGAGIIAALLGLGFAFRTNRASWHDSFRLQATCHGYRKVAISSLIVAGLASLATTVLIPLDSRQLTTLVTLWFLLLRLWRHVPIRDFFKRSGPG